MGIFNHNSYDDHSKDDKSVVTKAQLDALSTKIDNILNTITNLQYFLNISRLKHSSEDYVKFISINEFPFESTEGSTKLRIKKKGPYLIIFNDYINIPKNSRGNVNTIRFWRNVNDSSHEISRRQYVLVRGVWTNANLTTLIKVDTIDFNLLIDCVWGIFYGEIFSSFFIKYLGP